MSKDVPFHLSELLDDTGAFKLGLTINAYNTINEKGQTIFCVEASHSILDVNQTLREKNEFILEAKLQLIINQWIRLWNKRNALQDLKKTIQEQTEERENILRNSLLVMHKANLDKLKNNSDFEETESFKNLKKKLEDFPVLIEPSSGYMPPRPFYHEPEITLSQAMLFQKKKIINRYQRSYEKKLRTWEKICDKYEKNLEINKIKFHEEVKAAEEEKKKIEQEIEEKRQLYLQERDKRNEQVDVLEVNYQSRQKDAVEAYFDLVLIQSEYPDYFPRNTEIEYQKGTWTLIVNYQLPGPDLIGREKAVDYETEPFKENIQFYTEDEFNKIYNDIVYKILLRVNHEIYEADTAGVLNSIQLNGLVNTLNKANGQDENICIATITTTRTEFNKVNLHKIDPQLCFRYLNGIGDRQLKNLNPIPTSQPFMRHREMLDPKRSIQESMKKQAGLINLSMQDFEHTLMEIFEKEFRMEPGEMKLIEGSPEGVFEFYGIDPNPFLGGKILIQAMRSTVPIGVSSVKELFGSLIHEGAIKGVLVTTSDFTTEAIEFAKNKPLSLINGNKLLALFENHGQQPQANLQEIINMSARQFS
jgi:restriction system protein